VLFARAVMSNEALNADLMPLFAAASKRDAAGQLAFRQIYERTGSKLYGVAVRILRREDWAEEVLQECYVSIWNHAGDYNLSLSAPMTWMTSIVRNRSLDWLRKPHKEDATDDDAFFEAVESEELGPLELLEQNKDAQAVNRCLGTLEDKQKRAIAMAFYEGLTHAELAEQLDEPLGTVKTWVRRGLLRLKECLGSMYSGSDGRVAVSR
jgi:RNA polymerase sigma-70 factor, ECF subfamily